VAGYLLRDGLMSIEDAWDAIKGEDEKLDPRILRDFLDFTGYTEPEFWDIVATHRRKR